MRKTKIVVPIMLTELAELEKVSVSDYRTADIVEWRADFLSADEILEMAPKFFEKFKESKILFTLRTVREGGIFKFLKKIFTDFKRNFDLQSRIYRCRILYAWPFICRFERFSG
jgi:3-dehydroquinate dehydratase